MSTNSAKQGGSLSDMAVSGTSIPGDAGVQNIIPSVPRPDQTGANRSNVVDNATDIPRSSADVGATGEVSTGYVESSRKSEAGKDRKEEKRKKGKEGSFDVF